MNFDINLLKENLIKIGVTIHEDMEGPVGFIDNIDNNGVILAKSRTILFPFDYEKIASSIKEDGNNFAFYAYESVITIIINDVKDTGHKLRYAIWS